ncbi:sigma-70 family RNA polymerase sigma factor [Saprospiraceae bacterium]|nr:sigma-70 family RNA polymerase sigma factor [bacterium]MDB4768586.1 sigma-70 family RNA polymerase sigma factor [Saprospiraceae bacterium]MDC3210533.1 sigma-70 family RNA polymerase sigma factor [Saprospiraceae bacterium]MDG1433234.1 sigma-70 family RNA polymerase sigma factor [Saprospiraceae bacterium]
MTEQQIIQGCRKQDRHAQQALYQRYSPKMFGVCKRYLKNHEDAEDVLVEGLFKAISKIEMYKGDGSFEGWIRRIIVNEALMHLRKNKNFKMTVEISNIEIQSFITIQDELEAQDIYNLLDKLPTGYRTIFNLYVVEGFKHREIAEQLNISINTSKSQLILAKKRLQKLVRRNQIPGVGGILLSMVSSLLSIF